MKNSLMVWIALASFAAQAATPVFDKDLLQSMSKTRTAGDLPKIWEEHLDDDSIKFIQNKIKGNEKTPMRIEKTGESRLFVRAGNISFTLEFNEPVNDDRFVFTINQKEVSFYSEDSDEKLWQNITEALPKTQSNDSAAQWLIDLFIPRAEANMMLGMLLGGAAAYALTKSMSGSKKCKAVNAYREHIHECRHGGLTENEYQRAKGFLQSRVKPNKCKKQRQKLKACLQMRQPITPSAPAILPAPTGSGVIYQ